MPGFHLTPAEGLARMPGPYGDHYDILLQHGSLEVGLYAPKSSDPQTPHTRDELYVIIAGRGTFRSGDRRHDVGPGDVLFVPAHVEHHFESFSEDFSTWVVFYGPAGGEKQG
jgi:mannose-6-phosphate isomerase-like protein (cupin superfamily)